MEGLLQKWHRSVYLPGKQKMLQTDPVLWIFRAKCLAVGTIQAKKLLTDSEYFFSFLVKNPMYTLFAASPSIIK